MSKTDKTETAKRSKEHLPHPKGGIQPHTHYKLGQKDHKVIIDALGKFIPVYVIAKKIGCNYRVLLSYIHDHPELEQVRKDADDNMVSFAKGKLMSKVASGHAGSIMFLLERLDREHFGRYATIENVGELPSINIGVYGEKDFVEPLDPQEVSQSGNASDLLDAAVALAHQRQEEQDAIDEAEAEANNG